MPKKSFDLLTPLAVVAGSSRDCAISCGQTPSPPEGRRERKSTLAELVDLCCGSLHYGSPRVLFAFGTEAGPLCSRRSTFLAPKPTRCASVSCYFTPATSYPSHLPPHR